METPEHWLKREKKSSRITLFLEISACKFTVAGEQPRQYSNTFCTKDLVGRDAIKELKTLIQKKCD